MGTMYVSADVEMEKDPGEAVVTPNFGWDEKREQKSVNSLLTVKSSSILRN